MQQVKQSMSLTVQLKYMLHYVNMIQHKLHPQHAATCAHTEASGGVDAPRVTTPARLRTGYWRKRTEGKSSGGRWKTRRWISGRYLRGQFFQSALVLLGIKQLELCVKY
ncbi:hypothetical protein NL108_011274 [Boleophthalmus pectinirostris]|nr:hypothetical protein NL108_011274 [Boleophthalmus pectinirostris]